MVAGAGGKGGWELLCNGYRVSVSQDNNVTVVAVAQQCECVTELYVHLRVVQDSKFYAACILQ